MITYSQQLLSLCTEDKHIASDTHIALHLHKVLNLEL